MADFEKVEVAEDMVEVRFARSDFAQVIFHDIAETYPTDANVCCAYTLTPALTPSSRDWVGLYKVGWSTYRDYVYFEWAALPEGYQTGTTAEGSIIFKAGNLPKDDGEFYQFCYVTSVGQVRGASTPFQFKQPSAKEYIAVEDEDNDLMIIKTRTAALEEDLRKAAFENESLLKSKAMLECERDGLLKKLVELEKLAQQESEEKVKLQSETKTLKERLCSLDSEATDMQMVHDGLREKINQVNQEKEEVLKRLEDNEVYLKSLQEKIKTLINEKDALVGKNKALEDEKEMLKNHFSSSETTKQGYVQQMEQLREELANQEAAHKELEEVATELHAELDKKKLKLRKQTSVNMADKGHIEELSEGLRNCEDMLAAAEHCKKMLNDEVKSLQLAHQKISEDLEKSKSESHSLKIQMAKVEERHKHEEQELKEQIRHLHRGLEEKTKERDEIDGEMQGLVRQMKEIGDMKKTEEQGPMIILQKAQADLKKRYSKIKHENEEMKKELDELAQRKAQLEEERADMRQEVTDLKERLQMGREEFQDKYIECRRLQLELRKLDRQVKKTSSERQSSESSQTPEKETCEMQTSTAGSSTVDASTTAQVQKIEAETSTSMPPEDIADLTNSELQAQLDDLGRELESRSCKKQRYKIKYQEEREKNAFLQRYYFDELKKKDAELQHKEEEVQRLKRQMQDLQDDLISKLNRKETTIEKQTDKIRRLTVENLQFVDKFQKLDQPQKPPPIPVRHQPQFQRVLEPPCSPTFSPPPTCQLTASTPMITSPPLQPLTGSPLREDSPSGSSCGSVSKEDLEKLARDLEIPLNCGEKTAPLRPLPPPLQPEITPEARLAAVRAKCEELHVRPPPLDNSVLLEEVKVEPTDPELTEVKVEPSAPPSVPQVNIPECADQVDGEEDKFEDAVSEPVAQQATSPPSPPPKQCPVCKMEFPANISDVHVLDHIDSHYGPICPLCAVEFDVGYSQALFQEHVDSHFED